MQNRSALYTLVSIFFFWGFVAASNSILIPTFKSHFNLTQTQAQLVDSAFFIAYTVGSLLYFLYSWFVGDLLNKIGYKNGLILGLFISALGALGFIPASQIGSYPIFLASLFVIAFGFSLQQIVVNPFVIALGSPATGAHRLNLGGSLNSLGTTIAPVLLSYILFKNIELDTTKIELNSLITPALILVGLFLFAILVLYFSNLPTLKNEENNTKELGAFRYPQLTLGMLGIFIYVGVEVSIGSNLGEYLRVTKGLDKSQISHWVSLYWGSLMIGRWVGAVDVFKFQKNLETIAKIIVPFIAFGVIYGINALKGSPVNDFIGYIPFILIALISFFISGKNASKSLIVLGLTAAFFMLVGVFTTGDISLYALLSGGLFCSVLWPCIFNLAVAGLGKYTNQGSSLLIMMICGGAFIPVAQASLSEIIGIQHSYIVAFICFLYLAFYGWYAKKTLDAQGVVLDSEKETGH